MGRGFNEEDSSELEESMKKTGFIYRVFSLPLTILDFVFNCFVYGPGVGKISTEKIIKHRVAKIDTTIGKMSIPVMKMPCFDLTFGFFSDTVDVDNGIHDLDDFEEKNGNIFPLHISLKMFESYWILNYRRPKDIFGENEVTCFIENQLDGLVYIFRIKENQLIDYEKIISDYETEVDTLNFMERMEREAVNIEPPADFCNDGCRKRIKLDNETCCVNDGCFDENSTTIKKTHDL